MNIISLTRDSLTSFWITWRYDPPSTRDNSSYSIYSDGNDCWYHTTDGKKTLSFCKQGSEDIKHKSIPQREIAEEHKLMWFNTSRLQPRNCLKNILLYQTLVHVFKFEIPSPKHLSPYKSEFYTKKFLEMINILSLTWDPLTFLLLDKWPTLQFRVILFIPRDSIDSGGDYF